MEPFWMILSDFQWLSEIFNDAKHCAVYLQQLSFLLRDICLETAFDKAAFSHKNEWMCLHKISAYSRPYLRQETGSWP